MILKSYSTFVFVKFLLNLTFLFSTVSKASAFSLLTYFSLTSDSFLKSLMLDGFLVSSLGLGSKVGFLFYFFVNLCLVVDFSIVLFLIISSTV